MALCLGGHQLCRCHLVSGRGLPEDEAPGHGPAQGPHDGAACHTSVGALTTDEQADIPDAPAFRDRFDLRFTQRHVLMSSMGLAGRVLTLTGRMSVFRADLATDPGFIAQVHSDHVQHWRLGRVRFLTGADKFTCKWDDVGAWPAVYDVTQKSDEGNVSSGAVLAMDTTNSLIRSNGRLVVVVGMDGVIVVDTKDAAAGHQPHPCPKGQAGCRDVEIQQSGRGQQPPVPDEIPGRNPLRPV